MDNTIDDGMRPWGHSDYEFLINNKMSEDIIKQSPSTPWKYNEEAIVKELLEYIRGTYTQHYSAGDQKIQTLDLIEACGDGEAFCRSNILKYASRYDKKGSARRDIMKILHYAVLLMNFNDKNAVRETYNQHYSAGDQKIQTLDLIEACGDGEAFCRSNILKYASRYDKKGSARRDIMKILHYAVLLLNFNDKNAVRETYNQ